MRIRVVAAGGERVPDMMRGVARRWRGVVVLVVRMRDGKQDCRSFQRHFVDFRKALVPLTSIGLENLSFKAFTPSF